MELVREFVAGPTAAGAGRVAALQHEAGDHPVKDRTVIERPAGFAGGVFGGVFRGPFRQPNEVSYRLGRMIREKLDPDIATVGVQGRVEVHDDPSCHGSRRDPVGPRYEAASQAAWPAREDPRAAHTAQSPRAPTVTTTNCRPLIDCFWVDSASTATGPLATAYTEPVSVTIEPPVQPGGWFAGLEFSIGTCALTAATAACGVSASMTRTEAINPPSLR